MHEVLTILAYSPSDYCFYMLLNYKDTHCIFNEIAATKYQRRIASPRGEVSGEPDGSGTSFLI